MVLTEVGGPRSVDGSVPGQMGLALTGGWRVSHVLPMVSALPSLSDGLLQCKLSSPAVWGHRVITAPKHTLEEQANLYSPSCPCQDWRHSFNPCSPWMSGRARLCRAHHSLVEGSCP